MVGRFVIRSRLGAGGMGEVYRADDTRLKRSVALKRIAPRLRADEHYRQRFLKEAEHASRLSDQRIAAVYDVLEESDETFLVMEYVEGVTLRERLTGPFRLADFLPVAIQCAEALVAAHEKAVVHRDIKPENIMLTPRGQIKILDFGVAKRLPRSDDDTDTSSTGSGPGRLSGTPAYMAPEVLLEQPSDERADIFSLGVVCYEMLAGQHPFRTESFLETSDRILHSTPLPLRQVNPQVPESLSQLISGMLAKDPAGRPATAVELLPDLRALERGEKPPPRLREILRGPAIPRVAAACVAVIAFALFVFRLMPSIQQRTRQSVTTAEVPQGPRLAVLPPVALDREAATGVLAKRLNETLTARLSQLTERYSLQIVPLSEVREKGVSTPEEALREFGANLVVQYTVEQAGGKIRFAYLLLDTPTRRQVRGGEITAPPVNPSQLREEAANLVVAALEAELTARKGDSLRVFGTRKPDAYDDFVRGRRILLDYHEPQNIDSAIAVFNHALEHDPKFAHAYAGLGEAYLRRYEQRKDPTWVSQALEACRNAVLYGLELPDGPACLGMVYNGTGRYEEAITVFAHALTLDPTYVEAFQAQAHAYDLLQRPEQAEQTYRQALRLRPGYWGGYRDLGKFYYLRGRFADAAAMYQRVIDLAPENPMGYVGLGGMYYQQNRWREARTAFEKSLTVRPTYEAYNNLATLYFYEERDFSKAASMFEKVLEFNDKDYFVWGNLAAAYHWVPGNRFKARAAYERAARMAEEQRAVNPRDPKLLGDLAGYYAMLGKRDEALLLLEAALARAPNNVELMFIAGETYERLNQREEALKWVSKALERGYSAGEVERSPELAKLRTDPRFKLRQNR